MYVESFSFIDLLQLNLYLGYPVLLVGLFASVLLFRQFDWSNLRRRSAWLRALGNLLATFALSAIVWVMWPFEFDVVMYEVVYIPAVVGQTVVLLVTSVKARLHQDAG